MGHMGLGIRTPGTHAMRIFFGEFFDGQGDPAIGVTFTKNGVYGRAQNFGVGRTNLFFLVILRVGGKVGNRKPFVLKFSDRILQLRTDALMLGSFIMFASA